MQLGKPDFETKQTAGWELPIGGATVGSWLLHVPRAHPVWDFYLLTGVHLRPAEGLPPPDKWEPGASHELLIAAINPDTDPRHTKPPFSLLQPFNYVAQVADASDADVYVLVRHMARAAVCGHASPDSDWRSWWDKFVGFQMEELNNGGRRWTH